MSAPLNTSVNPSLTVHACACVCALTRDSDQAGGSNLRRESPSYLIDDTQITASQLWDRNIQIVRSLSSAASGVHQERDEEEEGQQ